MNRITLVVLAVLVLASAGFGLLQLEEVRKLTASAAAWDAERAALQKRIWELQRRNGDLERNRGSVASSQPTPRADGPLFGDAAPTDDRAAGNLRDRARNEGGRFGAMMANPEIQKLMAVQQKAALDGHYSSLFKQLQLSPADLDKFKNLLVDKQSAVRDVMAAARAEGLTGRDNRDQIRDLVQGAQNEVDNTIRSTLGDAAYSQYQNYEATQPQRNIVTQLEQRLSYSSAPLNDAQSQQLVQILAATSPTNENGARNGAGGASMAMALGAAGPGGPAFFGGPSTTITADAITQAQGVLSAQQVSALQGLQQEQQASAQLRQQMRSNLQVQTSTAPTAAAPTSSPGK